jgi:hypothetical protein
MTTQLTTILTDRARHTLSPLLLRQRSASSVHRVSGHVFRTRRDLATLRREVRQLEYIQISLLGAVDRLLQATQTIVDETPTARRPPK